MSRAHLTDISTHFAFGENWSDFLQHVDDDAIIRAEAGLRRSLRDRDVAGRTFLDIGCGSGLHALAAVRMGAERVLAIDIDPKSVATTRALLAKEAPNANVEVMQLSIFDASPEQLGTFDFVYSWGVLHHSGDMWRAIEKASLLVSPRGMLAIALYRKTRLCGLWRLEKRVYTSAPEWLRAAIQMIYKSAFFVSTAALLRNPFKIRERYHHRGMNYDNDVHDWLGGYPYESASWTEVADNAPPGFAIRQRLDLNGRNMEIAPIPLGIFGSGCDEYVFDEVASVGGRSAPIYGYVPVRPPASNMEIR